MSDLIIGEVLHGLRLNSWHEAADLIEQQQAEINALKTHVERFCEKIEEYHSEDVAAEDALNDLAVLLADTPCQSIVDHDRELLTRFAQFLNERCDLHVASMVRPFLEQEK